MDSSENLLGYYYDPLFGDSKVHFVGQLTPQTLAPDFGDNTELDSVILTIPYSSTASTSEDTTTYELDSLYGSSPIKLSVFKNNYFLRDFDPNADLRCCSKLLFQRNFGARRTHGKR